LAASLDKADRHAIGLRLMRVQFGWPIGRPLVRSLKAQRVRRALHADKELFRAALRFARVPWEDGLWEVRSSLPSAKGAARTFKPSHEPIAPPSVLREFFESRRIARLILCFHASDARRATRVY
jgi:hypothetical protein